MTVDLYDDPDLYDVLMGEPPSAAALSFIDELVAAYGSPILELACGTGRYTIALAQRGHAITGLDRNERMLERAREKAARARVHATWVCADMRRFLLDASFGLVVVPSQSFAHLQGREDVELTLACVRRQLAPGGALLIEIDTPSPAILARALADGGPFTTREPSYRDPRSGAELTASICASYDPARQILSSTYRWRRDDGGAAGSFVLGTRQFFPQEIDALLHYNGFQIVAKYGDLARTAFADDPAHQHIVCRPR